MSERVVATCANHPQREAIGVCVQCHTRVCSECSTKVEGINYCVSCLAGLALQGGRPERRASRRGRGLAPYMTASGYTLMLCAAVWMLLEVLLPGSG